MNSQSVAAAAVKKNLGPDPSMQSKVDLLRRLVAMREQQRKSGPRAGTNPPMRPFPGGGRPRSPMKDPGFGFRPKGY